MVDAITRPKSVPDMAVTKTCPYNLGFNPKATLTVMITIATAITISQYFIHLADSLKGKAGNLNITMPIITAPIRLLEC